jgi:hypothetical protein
MPASHRVKKANAFGPIFYAGACGDRICRNGDVAVQGPRHGFRLHRPGLVPAQSGNAV